MDLEPFRRINPCGYAGMNMTQLRDLTQSPQFDIHTIAQKLIVQLQRNMSYQDVQDLGNQLP